MTKGIHMFAMVPERTRLLGGGRWNGSDAVLPGDTVCRAKGLHTLTGATGWRPALGCYRLLRPTRPFPEV